MYIISGTETSNACVVRFVCLDVNSIAVREVGLFELHIEEDVPKACTIIISSFFFTPHLDI